MDQRGADHQVILLVADHIVVVLHHADSNIRAALIKPRQKVRQEAGRRAGHQPHRLALLLDAPQLRADVPHVLEHLSGPGLEQRAALRQHDAAAPPLEELGAQFLLQLPDDPAEGRLRQIQFPGRPGHMFHLRHLGEIP